MRSLVAALSLAWLTALIAFAAAPCRVPAWPVPVVHVAKVPIARAVSAAHSALGEDRDLSSRRDAKAEAEG